MAKHLQTLGWMTIWKVDLGDDGGLPGAHWSADYGGRVLDDSLRFKTEQAGVINWLKRPQEHLGHFQSGVESKNNFMAEMMGRS